MKPGTALTTVGAKRLLANAGGESLGAIAEREGVAKQSVAESIERASFSVGEALSDVAIHSTAINGPDAGTTTRERASELLIRLLLEIATDAKKPVIYGGSFEMKPDYALRANVSFRLLDYMEAYSERKAAQSGPINPGSGVVAREEVVETKSRRRTRREIHSGGAP